MEDWRAIYWDIMRSWEQFRPPERQKPPNVRYDLPDLQSFLGAILANPDGNTPILILADFLEDHGAGGEAEALRSLCHRRELMTDATQLEKRCKELRAMEERSEAHKRELMEDIDRLEQRREQVERAVNDVVRGKPSGVMAQAPEYRTMLQGQFDPGTFDPSILQAAVERERAEKERRKRR